MKKTMLVLGTLLLAIGSFSQTKSGKFNTNYMQVGKWNVENRKFEFEDEVKVNLIITMTDSKVWIDDNANTNLTILKDAGTIKKDEYTSRAWDCLDEKKRKCNLLIAKYNDGQRILSIMYNNLCFRYYVSNSRIDNF